MYFSTAAAESSNEAAMSLLDTSTERLAANGVNGNSTHHQLRHRHEQGHKLRNGTAAKQVIFHCLS